MNAPFIDFKTTLITHHKGAEYRAVGDEIFLVHPDGEQIHNLNPMAAALWRVLEQPITGQDMTALVLAAFPIMAAPKVEADVKRIVAELLSGGFVEVKKKR